MLHHNRPLALLHLVLRPPGTKLRADLLEAVAESGQPSVPGHAHANQCCHVVAQPRRPPLDPSGYAELCREDAGPMRSEEVGEFRSPLRLCWILLCHTASLRVLWYC